LLVPGKKRFCRARRELVGSEREKDRGCQSRSPAWAFSHQSPPVPRNTRLGIKSDTSRTLYTAVEALQQWVVARCCLPSSRAQLHVCCQSRVCRQWSRQKLPVRTQHNASILAQPPGKNTRKIRTEVALLRGNYPFSPFNSTLHISPTWKDTLGPPRLELRPVQSLPAFLHAHWDARLPCYDFVSNFL